MAGGAGAGIPACSPARIVCMRKVTTVLMGVLFSASLLVPATLTNAAELTIAIGDRPYYTHGPHYVESGVRWVWVPGHWANKKGHKKVWIHGHYAKR